MKDPHKILLVYARESSSLRATTSEHLFSFQKYSPYPVDYVNIAKEPLPERLREATMA